MQRLIVIMGMIWIGGGLCCLGQSAADNEPPAASPLAAEAADLLAEDAVAAMALPPLVPADPDLAAATTLVGLKYEAMDLDEVLKQYSEWTGLAILKAPDVPAVKITLKCPKRLPKAEALLAIEGVLGMHGVALVPMGANFLKVVPISAARQFGMETGLGELDQSIADTDKLVSRIIELKHIDISEAQGTIQSLLHSYGKIMPLERVNCLLVTDTAINIKRVLEILEVIDQPIELREELRIFPIIHAKASEIMTKIEAILADVQTRDSRTRLIQQQLSATRTPTPSAQPGRPASTRTTDPVLDLLRRARSAEQGVAQDKIKMVADDRTNSLIIIARPEHFRFIENIIQALDCQVEPDVSIKVFFLEYAEAKEVLSLLTSLVAAAADTKTQTPTPPARPTPALTPSFEGRSAADGQRGETAASRSGEIQISGKLSSDVKIIADQRTNALLVMATKNDMLTIETLLAKLDISLAQVLIEVVILEVGLNKDVKMGIDWLQKSMVAYNKQSGGGRRAFLGFAGSSMQGTYGQLMDATTLTDVSQNIAGAGSGLSYYFSIFDLNIDAVMNMLKTTSDARILSTPIILTTDNKEAKIMVGEKRPIVTSTSISSGGTQQSGYEYKDIGIELTVTPHINKKGFVVMEVSQKINNVGEVVKIDGNEVPVITSREFGASISVNDRRTIVLGGLVSTETKKNTGGVPFLSDIPLLGYLFGSTSDADSRRELMVLITPYVLNDPQDIYTETARRFNAMQKADDLLRVDWSESELGKPLTVEQLRQRRFDKERSEREIEASWKEMQKEAARSARQTKLPAPSIPLRAEEGITNVTFKTEEIMLEPVAGSSNALPLP